MELFEINPHIRFCKKITRPRGAHFVRTRDCRIFYVLSDVCTITVEDHVYPLGESDLLYIPSGIPYRMDCEVNAPIQMIIVNFDFDQSHRHLQKPFQPKVAQDFCDEDWIRVHQDLPFSSPIFIEKNSKVQALLLETEKEFAHGNLFGNEYASALLRQILFEILRGKEKKPNTEESLAGQIKQYLNRHYTEDVTAEALGNHFGYHPYHLNRIFKKQLGTTLRQYLIEQRIQSAKNLLLVTELTVGEIACAVGISDQAYFSYCFKKCTGFSPSEYRCKKGVRYL